MKSGDLTYGLLSPDGLVNIEGGLGSTPVTLFCTAEEADLYVSIHHLSYKVVPVALVFDASLLES